MKNVKKKFSLIIIIALSCFYSCSDDNDMPTVDNQTPQAVNDTITQQPENPAPPQEEPVPQQNGFTYNNQFYETPFLYVNDENTDNNSPSDIGIIISDKDISSSQDFDAVTFAYFDVNDTVLNLTSYSGINDYRIYTNSPFTNGTVIPGTILFDDSTDNYKAQSSLITIQSVTQDIIILSYKFTRPDGTTLDGFYSGAYININN